VPKKKEKMNFRAQKTEIELRKCGKKKKEYMLFDIMLRMSNNIYTSLDYWLGSKEEEVKEEERRRNCVSNPVGDSFFNGSFFTMKHGIMEGSAHKLCVRSAVEVVRPSVVVVPQNLDFFSENQIDTMENTTQPVHVTGIQMYCPNPRCLTMQLWNGVDHKCAHCEGSQFTADSWKDHEDENSEMSGATSTLVETTKTFELEMFPEDWSFVEGKSISQDEFESTPEFKESLEALEPFGWVDSQNAIARAIEQKPVLEADGFTVIPNLTMGQVDKLAHNAAVKVIGGKTVVESKGELLMGKVWEIKHKCNKNCKSVKQTHGDLHYCPVASNGLTKKVGARAYKEQVFGSDFDLGLNYPTDYDTGKQLTNTRSVSYVAVNSDMEDMTDEHVLDFLYQCGAGCKRNHFHTRKTFETNNITPEYLVRRDLAIANSIAKAERVAKGDKQTPETREWVERYIEMNKEVINVEQFDLDILTESQCKALTWTLNRKSNPKGFSVEKALTSLVKTCPREVGI